MKAICSMADPFEPNPFATPSEQLLNAGHARPLQIDPNLVPFHAGGPGQAGVGPVAPRPAVREPPTAAQTIRAFHGSAKQFEHFLPEDAPHWFSSSDWVATSFGKEKFGLMSPHQGGSATKWRQANPFIYEAKISGKIKNIDLFAEAKRIAAQIGVPPPPTPADAIELVNWSHAQHDYIDEAKTEGFDAVHFKNVADAPDAEPTSHIAVINPSIIKILRRYQPGR
jgi:hypothetical protein